MFPYFQLFGRTIGMYGLMIVLGAFLGVLYACMKKNHYGLKREDILFSSVYAGIGAVLGGKLLFLIISLPQIIEKRDIIFSDIRNIVGLIQGGFVFYGGLVGALLFMALFTSRYKISYLEMAETIIPSIPLVHAFGRLGCFFAGCCYGIPSRYGIMFNNSPIAPHDIKLFPVQLLESALNLVLFAVLVFYTKKNRQKGSTVGLYLLCYSVIRFIVEFFRYDEERGFFLLLSTSQWISILIFTTGIVLLSGKIKLHTDKNIT